MILPWLSGALAVTLLAAAADAGEAPRLDTWKLENGALVAGPDAPAVPLEPGSLMKPFVAKAWALAHPGQPSPRFTCASGSGCWFRPGHGELGLAQALAVSCNTYFLRLAEATPMPVLASTLGAEGFRPEPGSPGAAMGLGGPAGPAIAPAALLAAYVRLTRQPWPVGEAIRQEVLAGLREAALTGTASGLSHRGFWAKTGTVPGPAGDPARTSGFALAVDDSGWAILARLDPGTGAQAAAALAAPLDRLRPWAQRLSLQRAPAPPIRPGPSPDARPGQDPARSDTVTIRLFDLIGAPQYRVRNLGPGPVPCAGGFLGPGAVRDLVPGDDAGPGLLEVTGPGTGLERRLQGQISCRARSLIARVSRREYVAGVIAAELPGNRSWLRVELGAAILRFLALGPRHPDADVCDNTHFAFFIGRGPRLDWSNKHLAKVSAAQPEDPGLPDDVWSAMVEVARTPGPSQWTAHCGGRPLSARAVWGQGDPVPFPCPRHGPGQSRPWTRAWSAADLAKAFGGPVQGLEVGADDGVWVLRVQSSTGRRSFRYDQAHRLLAKVLGWDALPSPADAVVAAPGGFKATGVGQGHRVGLCLGD